MLNGRDRVPLSTVTESVALVLEMLLEARTFSEDLGGDVWDFAVDLEALKQTGSSDSLLRWLLLSGYAEHRIDCTRPVDSGRVFDNPGPLIFTPHSCFVLTPTGIDCLYALREGHLPEEPVNADVNSESSRAPTVETSPEVTNPPQIRPVWDPVLKELMIGGQLVKRYKLRSPNQERVLVAFEEEGWPVRIDDPLPPHATCPPKTRLRDTIKNLNRHQMARLIRFVGDGTGEGVRWQGVSKRDRDAARS